MTNIELLVVIGLALLLLSLGRWLWVESKELNKELDKNWRSKNE